MLIRVIETTDDKHIGVQFELPNVGDILKLGDEEWNVVGVDKMEGSMWKIWNFNYVAYVEEV